VREVVTVKVQSLTPEAFEPYGEVLSLHNPVFPEVDEGSPMLMLSRVRPGDDKNRVEQMAVHFSYSQAYIPVRGAMILILAPPPDNPDSPKAEFHLDYGKVAAFALETGEAVLIGRGVWHNLLPLTEECQFISATRKGSEQIYPEGELVAGKRTDEQRAAGREHARFIEIIDFAQRDGKEIEVVR
jgi:ureidoglycolate hydrolase